jgi:hypothetical protein
MIFQTMGPGERLYANRFLTKISGQAISPLILFGESLIILTMFSLSVVYSCSVWHSCDIWHVSKFWDAGI